MPHWIYHTTLDFVGSTSRPPEMGFLLCDYGDYICMSKFSNTLQFRLKSINKKSRRLQSTTVVNLM
jgi:hypothetical protein